MSASTAPDDPDFRFLRDTFHHLVYTLRLTLPPLPSDSAEDLARRDRAAVSCIAGLCPADETEARLAAEFVIANEYGSDCLRLAQRPDIGPEMAAKCRAEARSMMREAKSALRTLLKLQDVRTTCRADSASCHRAGWVEHCARGLMEQALSAIPPPAPRTEPTAPQPQPEPEPAPAPLTGAAATHHRAATDPVLIAAAERYAALYPERAASIRRTGKLPPDVRYFDPPEAALASALIAARTPALAALDREDAQPNAA